MGQWNRRYRPGRRRNYNYQEPPPSPPRTQPLPYGRSENGVPSWQIDFCYLNGVTWDKISAAKKFMYCHDSVLKWDDVAGEEAFHHARRRYYEKSNGLPCEGSSPDPDMYIGKVDWNSYINPELISDLDRAYFNPDDEGKSGKWGTNSKESSSWSLVHNDKNNGRGNPWESNVVQGIGGSKSLLDPWEQYGADDKNANEGENPWESNPVQGTGRVKSFIDPWERDCTDDKSINKGENFWERNRAQGAGNLKSHVDPWEQYCVEVDKSISNNAWRDSGDDSSLWNRGQSQNMHSSPHFRANQHQQCAGYIQMKGPGHVGYNSWQRNDRGNDLPINAYSNDRIRSDWGNSSERKKATEFANDDSRRWGFRGQNRGGREGYDGCRKREGSMQHKSRKKSLRLQSNDYGNSYQWRN